MDNKDGIVDAPHEPHDKAAAGIRSRITVVCAECKRLKLKCDRRAPCSSCVKRETTARCVYSAAAAEKIDVQSLHNRVSALEDSWRQWTNTQPGQTPTLAPPAHCNPNQPPPPPPPPPPPAIVASGPDDLASALVGLDDVSALWAAHLGLHLAHIPLRPSTPDDSDDDDLDEDVPPSLLHVRQIPTTSRTGVTRAHIQILPCRPVRAALWAAAERAIGPHTGLAPRVRMKFEQMCMAIENEPLGSRTKWPLSLLAVGTAGLAIGAQVVAESDGAIPLPLTSSPSHTPSSSSSHSQHPSPISQPLIPLPCARTLISLSLRALSPNGQDTDTVLAALLHAARGTLDGRARIAPRVWPDVCRAVGVARGMGLGVDRDGTGKDEVGEWRRRVWWEVYCADLFTSDYIGLPPMIDDSTFSTTLPKDEDEKEGEDDGDKEKEDGMAYFVLKCRLAQLIKTLKRRLLDERPLPLEGAASMERAINEFTRDLPPAWKLDMSAPTVAMGLGDEEAAIMVQRCELATAANSLILKAYYPFLKQSVLSTSSEAFASPHQAALACSTAAHTLIHASLAAHKLLPRTRPYAFAKQLFGGAVVAASVVIGTPTGMWARVALDDVRGALGVLRELDMACGAGRRIEGVPGEAVRVVEVLVSKAEAAMGVGSSGVGMKRKRGQDGPAAGDEGLGLGFEMPYMGPGVVTCGLEGEGLEAEKEREGTVAPVQQQQPQQQQQQQPQPPAPTATMPPVEPRREREPKRDTKPAKVSPYPRIGVRVRTKPSGAKMARSRAGSSVNGERSPSGGGVPSQQQQAVQQQQQQQPNGLQQQQQSNGLQQQPNGLPQQQPNGLPQQRSGTLPPQSQQQQQQQQPSSTPSLTQQMTVPHQPALQVITEQATPYLNGTNGEYPSYAEPSYAMPYLINTPATPVVRTDYSREFYSGYEYATQVGMMPEGMMSEYGKETAGMLTEGMGGMGDGAGGMMGVGENGEAGRQGGWYRTSAGPTPGQTQTQGPWNGGFDAPGWDTRR